MNELLPLDHFTAGLLLFAKISWLKAKQKPGFGKIRIMNQMLCIIFQLKRVQQTQYFMLRLIITGVSI